MHRWVQRRSDHWLRLEHIIVAVVGVLLGRAGFVGDIFPFGVAFVLSLIFFAESRCAVVGAAAVLAGAATIAPSAQIVDMLLVFGLVIPVANGLEGRIKAGPATRISVGVLAYAVVRLTHLFLSVASPDAIGLLGLESVLIWMLTTLYAPAVGMLRGTVRRNELDSRQSVALAIALSSVILGTRGLVLWNYGVGEFLARWLVMAVGIIGGAGAAAAVGTSFGLILSLTGVSPIGGLGSFAVSGMLAGLFRRYGKPGVAVGFFLGNLVTSFDVGSVTEISRGLVATAGGTGLLLVTPWRFLHRLAWALPGTELNRRASDAREKRLKDVIYERLGAIAAVFQELSFVFADVRKTDAARQEKRTELLVEEVCRELCTRCTKYEVCWGPHLEESYRDLVKLIEHGEENGRIERGDVPAELDQRCFRSQPLVQTVNSVLTTQRRNERSGVEDWSRLIPIQLKGMSNVVVDLAHQVSVDTGESDELERLLFDAFKRHRVPCQEIQVGLLGSERFEITIQGRTGDNLERWRRMCASLVSEVTGIPYSPWKVRYGDKTPDDQICTVQLLPERRYKLDVATLRLTKEGNVISGDASSVVELRDGKMALVLSDGMGSGERASLESSAAVRVLGRLLAAGMGREDAVQILNSVLLLRSKEETYATVDLAVIDLYSGELEFIKIGASPSVIRRGLDVDVVRSSSVPAGILQGIDVEPHLRLMRHGDVLVMMTDGIVEAARNSAIDEGWVYRAAQRADADSPEAVARELVIAAREAAGGRVLDDMTILTAKLSRRDLHLNI